MPKQSEAASVALLLKRADRLKEEYDLDAPSVIKLTEARLIAESCEELLG